MCVGVVYSSRLALKDTAAPGGFNTAPVNADLFCTRLSPSLKRLNLKLPHLNLYFQLKAMRCFQESHVQRLNDNNIEIGDYLVPPVAPSNPVGSKSGAKSGAGISAAAVKWGRRSHRTACDKVTGPEVLAVSLGVS